MMKISTLLLLLTWHACGGDAAAQLSRDTGSMHHGQSPPFLGRGIVTAAAPRRVIELIEQERRLPRQDRRRAQETPETKAHVHPPEELNTKSTPSPTAAPTEFQAVEVESTPAPTTVGGSPPSSTPGGEDGGNSGSGSSNFGAGPSVAVALGGALVVASAVFLGRRRMATSASALAAAQDEGGSTLAGDPSTGAPTPTRPSMV